MGPVLHGINTTKRDVKGIDDVGSAIRGSVNGVASFQHLERYDAAKPLRAWLARIAINKSRDWRRRKRVRRFLSLAATLPVGAIEGLSQAKTAEILAISEKAVATRLSRARLRLSEKLEQA